MFFFFFFQAEDGIRDATVTGVQTCALPILFVQTRECDFGSVGNAYSPTVPVTPCPRANEIGNAVGDDEPGILVAHFRSPQASLGLHHTNSQLAGSTCPASNTRGCYRLTYRVAVVSDQPRKGG